MDPSLYSQTIINPLALFFSVIMCIMILTAKKEHIIIPAILVACLITGMQRVSILTVDFTMLRLIIIFGILRIFLRGEQSLFVMNKIDKFMIYYVSIKAIVYTIQWGTISALIYMLGDTIDILGCYFFVRLAINGFDEFDVAIKTLILVSIPIALFMLYEQFSGGRNLFSAFGGVPDWSDIREGRLRAQGAFSHSIMAGTFGAMLLPLSWGIWQRRKKAIAVIGFICSLLIVFASSSSGPIVTFVSGIFGICFWLLNKYTKTIVKLSFIMLIIMQFAMNAPVWHLISRIDLVGGSTGFHRFLLIDAAINNFSSWILLGIRDTSGWGRGLQDITNQYILEGVRGGIFSLIIFVMIITKCFQLIGKVRPCFSNKPELQKYIWSLGVLLFAHSVSFIAVSYFGQMVFFFFMLIAMISSLTNSQFFHDTKIKR